MSRGQKRRRERVQIILRVVFLVLGSEGWASSADVTAKLKQVQGWKGFSDHRIRRELWDLQARGYLRAGQACGFLYWRPSDRALQNCGFPGMPDGLKPRPMVKSAPTVGNVDVQEGGGQMGKVDNQMRRDRWRAVQVAVAELGGDQRSVKETELYEALGKMPECAGLMLCHMGKVLLGATEAGFIMREGEQGNYSFRSMAQAVPALPVTSGTPEPPVEIAPSPSNPAESSPPAKPKRQHKSAHERLEEFYEKLPGESPKEKGFASYDPAVLAASGLHSKASLVRFLNGYPSQERYVQHVDGILDYKWLKDPREVESTDAGPGQGEAPPPPMAPDPEPPAPQPTPMAPAAPVFTLESLAADEARALDELKRAQGRRAAVECLVMVLRDLQPDDWDTVIALARKEASKK